MNKKNTQTEVEVEKVKDSSEKELLKSNARIIDADISSTPQEKDKPSESKPKETYGYSVKLSSNSNTSSDTNTATQASQEKPAPTKAPEQASVKLPQQPSQNKQATNATAQINKAVAAPVKKTFNIIAKKTVSTIDTFARLIVGKESDDMNEVIKKARPPIVFGLWVIILTFFVGGLWAALAPLDKASHAQGFVVSSSKKQIIQNREGGVLEEIYVKEGQEVQKNQLLAKLNDTEIRSALESAKIQKASSEKQLELNKEQLAALEEVHVQGFIPKSRIIEAQIQQNSIVAHLSEAESKIITLEDRLLRASILSPVDGIVNQIQLHTQGASLAPGGTLMTITPRNENLLIEAYVSPNDIDHVHIGLKSKIRVNAFKHRSTAPLDGVVTYVSSDVVEPTQSHSSQENMLAQRIGLSYKVRIEVDQAQLKTISKYRDYELTPGMTADVTIVTGERTLLQYLLDPITTTFWHAFKEQ